MRYIGSRTFTAQNNNSSRFLLICGRGKGGEGRSGKLEYLRRMSVAVRGLFPSERLVVNFKDLTLHMVEFNHPPT